MVSADFGTRRQGKSFAGDDVGAISCGGFDLGDDDGVVEDLLASVKGGGCEQDGEEIAGREAGLILFGGISGSESYAKGEKPGQTSGETYFSGGGDIGPFGKGVDGIGDGVEFTAGYGQVMD